MPPSLLLLLHNRQQQLRQEQQKPEHASLLLALAEALQQRCVAAPFLSATAGQAGAAEGAEAATSELAVAILRAHGYFSK